MTARISAQVCLTFDRSGIERRNNGEADTTKFCGLPSGGGMMVGGARGEVSSLYDWCLLMFSVRIQEHTLARFQWVVMSSVWT